MNQHIKGKHYLTIQIVFFLFYKFLTLLFFNERNTSFQYIDIRPSTIHYSQSWGHYHLPPLSIVLFHSFFFLVGCVIRCYIYLHYFIFLFLIQHKKKKKFCFIFVKKQRRQNWLYMLMLMLLWRQRMEIFLFKEINIILVVKVLKYKQTMKKGN